MDSMHVCMYVCMYVFVTFTGAPLQPLHIAAVSGVPQLHQPIPYIHTSHTHMINFANANTYYLMYVCMYVYHLLRWRLVAPRERKRRHSPIPRAQSRTCARRTVSLIPVKLRHAETYFNAFIHSFIHTYVQIVLLLTLYCIMFCTILSIAEFFFWAFFFALAFAFVTKLLAAVFELCPLFFLAASAFSKSSSVVLGEYSRDAKGNAPLRPR